MMRPQALNLRHVHLLAQNKEKRLKPKNESFCPPTFTLNVHCVNGHSELTMSLLTLAQVEHSDLVL